MKETDHTFFAPQLHIKSGTKDISFYANAFGAKEHFCLTNDDGSIHVAEFDIDGAFFHLHEENPAKKLLVPDSAHGNTVTVGLFVPDVHAVMNKAIAAGAIEISPAKDYEYGYRQGEIKDPFGYHWLIQKKL